MLPFVTDMRLAGTILVAVVAELESERSARAKANANQERLTELARRQFLHVDAACMPRTTGATGSRDPACLKSCWRTRMA